MLTLAEMAIWPKVDDLNAFIAFDLPASERFEHHVYFLDDLQKKRLELQRKRIVAKNNKAKKAKVAIKTKAKANVINSNSVIKVPPSLILAKDGQIHIVKYIKMQK